MDWNALLSELDRLSLFELGCLGRALGNLSADPARIARARSLLRPGLEVEYWNSKKGDFTKAIVLELFRTSALVQHMKDQEQWTVHLSLIVPPDTKPILSPMPSSSRSEWRVGDLVGFKDRQNRERFGTIEKLNPRKAQVRLRSGEVWRVDYPLLVPIHELEKTVMPELPDAPDHMKT